MRLPSAGPSAAASRLAGTGPPRVDVYDTLQPPPAKRLRPAAVAPPPVATRPLQPVDPPVGWQGLELRCGRVFLDTFRRAGRTSLGTPKIYAGAEGGRLVHDPATAHTFRTVSLMSRNGGQVRWFMCLISLPRL